MEVREPREESLSRAQSSLMSVLKFQPLELAQVGKMRKQLKSGAINLS